MVHDRHGIQLRRMNASATDWDIYHTTSLQKADPIHLQSFTIPLLHETTDSNVFIQEILGQVWAHCYPCASDLELKIQHTYMNSFTTIQMDKILLLISASGLAMNLKDSCFIEKQSIYLKRNIRHRFGKIVGFQAVPVVQMLSQKYSHLKRNYKEYSFVSQVFNV